MLDHSLFLTVNYVVGFNNVFIVDAFADRVFAGNPAAVMPLESGVVLSDDLMQSIAGEMNLSETAFVTPGDSPDEFGLRWFTPTSEVDLCGHATMASAHVLWHTGHVSASQVITFHTRSGPLISINHGDRIDMDFPALPLTLAPPFLAPGWARDALFIGHSQMDWFFELSTEAELRALMPDFAEIEALGMRGVIVTAAASDPGYDFISRFFAPGFGVNEDPVTGSAHCALGPYWASKLNKASLKGFQASKRGGAVSVNVAGETVSLGGTAHLALEGVFRWE